MTATLEIVPSVLDHIRRTLVGLKMPRALEVLDQTVRQLERGEASALEVIDTLFAEELSLRENRRVKMALRMAKLSTVKTLTGRRRCTEHKTLAFGYEFPRKLVACIETTSAKMDR
jgi:hypothetical protein